jgi:hypothetical protein
MLVEKSFDSCDCVLGEEGQHHIDRIVDGKCPAIEMTRDVLSSKSIKV